MQDRPSISPLAVSPARAAKLAGVGRTTIYKALKANELASYLVGRRRLILVADLENWIRRQPAGPRIEAHAANMLPSAQSNASTPRKPCRL